MQSDPRLRPTALQILSHRRVEEAMDEKDDFVVTTPLKTDAEDTPSRNRVGSAMSMSSLGSAGFSRCGADKC